MTSGTDHQFCGDAILTLIEEVRRLRAKYAELLNVQPGAVALSPAVEALLVVDADALSQDVRS